MSATAKPIPTPDVAVDEGVGELTGRLFAGLLDPAARGRFTDLRSEPGSGRIQATGPDGRIYEAVVRPVEAS